MRALRTMYPLMFMVAAVAMFITCVPLLASEIDDRIESSAKKSYVFKTYLKGDDIKIQSKDDVVTLTGTVAEESHMSLAQDTVAGFPGVKSVDNQLKFEGEHAGKNSDVWLTMKVKTALLFHRNVSAGKTEVNVKYGIVTLRGEATSEAQKELTTEYAKEVEGVKDVKNEMIVSNNLEKANKSLGDNIDDASITAQVKMVLLSHRSTSSRNAEVETNNGVVTLSGKARNAAEKDLITKLISDINGVKSVVDNMTIDESSSTSN